MPSAPASRPSVTHPGDLARVFLNHDHWPVARDILDAVFRPGARVAVKSCHASSKALALDTPIATPGGWTTLGEIAVGDEVYDEQGRVVPVVSVSPIMEKPCYRVTFCTGESIVASDDHLWSAIDFRHRPRVIADWRLQWDRAVDVTTQQLAAEPRAGNQHRWRIPTCGALVGGQDWPLSTPPYTFGAWLGDGTATRAEITCGVEDVEHMLAAVGGRVERPVNRAPRIIFGTRRYLDTPGRETGGKRIPTAVLRSSALHRWAVLQGLMDTDGWATQGSGVSISQVRLDLARDIYDLVVSLGYKASVREQRAVLDGRDCGPCYVVSFSPDVCPFTLPRKIAKWQQPGKQASRFTQRTVVSTDPVGTQQTRCIGVDSPRHLYLAGRGLIPTHNTYTSADAVVLALLAGADVLTTAPTWEQVRTVLWGTVRRAVSDATVDLSGWSVNQTEIVTPSGAKALGLSTNEGVRFQGWHARPGSFLLVVFDEAPGVMPDIYESVQGISAGGDVRWLLIGNPVLASGPFYDIYAGDAPSWQRFTIDAFDTPNLRGLTLESLLALPEHELDDNPRPYLVTRRWVRDAYHQWGTDHPAWQSRVRGQFPLQADDALISLAWLEASKAKVVAYRATGVPLTAGVDVAGPGEDETVVCVRQGRAILDIAASSAPDARGDVVAALRPWLSKGLERVNVDSAGMGHYFMLHLADVLPKAIEVVGVNVGERPSDDEAAERFSNRKAEYYWRLREQLRADELQGICDQTTIAQLAGIRYKHDSRGRVVIESKEDARKRGVKSPDRAEAVMLSDAPENYGAALARAFKSQFEGAA